MALYDYSAEVVQVHDGDTVTLRVSLGFDIVRTDRFRLYGPDPDGKMGMNAPELNTPEGKAAKTYLEQRCKDYGNRLRIRTIRDREEKYGRMLVVLYGVEQGLVLHNINQDMLDTGHAALKKY